MSEPLDIELIRARANAASQGPWVVNCVQSQYAVISCDLFGVIGDWNISGENAAFVSHARTDIPALCDEVEILKKKLAIAMEALKIINKLGGNDCCCDDYAETALDEIATIGIGSGDIKC